MSLNHDKIIKYKELSLQHFNALVHYLHIVIYILLFTHIVGCVAKRNLKTQLSSRENANFVILRRKFVTDLIYQGERQQGKISKIIHVQSTSQHFLLLVFSAGFEISKSKPVKFAQ